MSVLAHPDCTAPHETPKDPVRSAVSRIGVATRRNHPEKEVLRLRQELAVTVLERSLRQLRDDWPALTADQIDRLRSTLA